MNEKKWNSRFFRIALSILAVFFCLAISIPSDANTARTVETEGKITFTGVYEPIDRPNPVPPVGTPEKTEPDKPNLIARPSENGNSRAKNLPKTNQLAQQGWIWLGILLITVSILFKTKKSKRNEEKV